jgi:CRP/FNR family cyclic AMP-dependent transcriptional regulator
MRSILEHCIGARTVLFAAGDTVIREGETTGRLFVLIEGRLDVVKGDTLVATLHEPGATIGEMSVLLDQPHSATVIATEASRIYTFDNAARFLESHPALALLLARLLAVRLGAATTYLADIKKQYAGYGNHLEMVGDVLQSLVSLPATDVSPGSDRQADPRL